MFYRRDEAIKMYETALYYEPENADVHYNVSRSLYLYIVPAQKILVLIAYEPLHLISNSVAF